MSYTIKGYDYDADDEPKPAVAVDRWYDRSERSWVVRLVDADGVQVGAAEYVAGRKFADIIEARMLRSLNEVK